MPKIGWVYITCPTSGQFNILRALDKHTDGLRYFHEVGKFEQKVNEITSAIGRLAPGVVILSTQLEKMVRNGWIIQQPNHIYQISNKGREVLRICLELVDLK